MNYSEALLKKSFDKGKYQVKAHMIKAYYDEFGFNSRVENLKDAMWEFCHENNIVYIDGIYDRIHPDLEDVVLEAFGIEKSNLYSK